MEDTMQKNFETLSNQELSSKISHIGVGGQPSRTLDKALIQVGHILNVEYGINMSEEKMLELMQGENTISLGGLDNYFKLFHSKVVNMISDLAA